MAAPTTERPGMVTPESSPFTRPWFLAAAGVLGLIVVVGLGSVLLPSGSAPHPRHTTAAPVSRPAPSPTPSGSACGLPVDPEQVPPASAPPSTSWVLVGSMAAPNAPKLYGPGAATASGLRSCYAPGPMGALYAAANFAATVSDPSARLAAVRELTAPGPGRDKAVALVSAGQVGAGGTGLQVAGFAFLGYAPDSAVVDLALSLSGKFLHVPLALSWVGGDWKVTLPPSGRPFDGVAPLPDLVGFVPWAGA